MRYVVSIPVIPPRRRSLDADARCELVSEAFEALTDWLDAHLTRPAERAVLAAIDASCLLEHRDEELGEGQLVAEIADHWYPGAVAATHWFTVAAQRARKELDAVLAPAGYRVGEPPVAEDGWPPLVPVGADLVVVERDGTLAFTEGLEPRPTPPEQAAIEEAARTRRCACELCRGN